LKRPNGNQSNLMKKKPALKHIESGTFSNYRTGYNMDQVSDPLDEREFLSDLESITHFFVLYSFSYK